ncbi:hypothetical protein PL9214430298 [Planktothrix tepida PCC 9214]|uniref:Uncharacterized protein n=1 Tax=Planktothrix tepida PCC 9214 TaxID=671072 RepID=A0A1J1LJG2_9CYAN|nr:hypothetical protein PL9214430298 [Planktothrix tepida PCC 9214]
MVIITSREKAASSQVFSFQSLKGISGYYNPGHYLLEGKDKVFSIPERD